MEPQDRLRRIRLVSERYHELQGLRGALIGTAYTVSAGFYLIASGWKDGVVHGGFAVALASAIAFPGMVWLDRYYEKTFGRVKPGIAAQRLAIIIPVGMTLAMIVENWLLKSSYAAVLLALGAYGLWIAIRDWPLRRYHFVSAATGFVAAGVQFTDAARQAPNSALAAGFLLVGVADFLTGLADHRLLTSSFAPPEHSPEQLQEGRR